eukprot:5021963-Karenia_brevis.AAC.1
MEEGSMDLRKGMATKDMEEGSMDFKSEMATKQKGMATNLSWGPLDQATKDMEEGATAFGLGASMRQLL